MKIAVEQVEDFLASFDDLRNLTDEPGALASNIQKYAERGRAEARRCFEVELTTDDDGVKALDDLLTAMHEALRPGMVGRLRGERISIDSMSRVALTLGCFYGEVLREQSQGKWKFVEWQGKRIVTLALTARASVTPLEKVAKHFMNGADDSLWKFHAFNRVLARTARKVNSMSPEERVAFQAKLDAAKEERKQKRREQGKLQLD